MKTKNVLSSLKALVPLYKEAGETNAEFLANLRRKLEHELDINFTATKIECIAAIPLDSFASGVCTVEIGRFNDKIKWIKLGERRYDLTVKLGEARTFGNSDGQCIKTSPFGHVTKDAVLEQLAKYKGVFEQKKTHRSVWNTESTHQHESSDNVNAIYSLTAICHEITLKKFEPPFIEMDVYCGANFHLSDFTFELAKALGTDAFVLKRHRKVQGPFTENDAIRSYEVSWKTLQEATALYHKRFSQYKFELSKNIADIRPKLKMISLYR